MGIITVKLNNPVNAKKVSIKRKKSSPVVTTVFEKPIVVQEDVIIKPSPPVISNDVNLHLFLSLTNTITGFVLLIIF